MHNRILNWISKKLGTDAHYLASGGFWLTIARAMFIVSAFILSIAFANLLPLEVFGTYQFVLSLVTIAGAFTLTGMNTVVMQGTARGFGGMLIWGFKRRLIWGLTVSVILLAGAVYYVLNDNHTLAGALIIASVFVPLLESFKLYRSYLVGKKDFKRNTLFSVYYQIIPLFVLLAALYLSNSVIVILFTYFVSNTLVVAFLFFTTKTLSAQEENRDIDDEGFRYSTHLSFLGVINKVAGNIDKILIFHFLGAAPVAIYHFAAAPPRQLRSLNKILEALLAPKLPNRSIPELKRSLPKRALLMFLVAGLITGAYIVAAPFFFSVFFPQYLDSIRFSQVFSLTLLFMPMVFFAQTFVAHAKKKELYIAKTVSPAVRIALFVVLIPLYGIWGVIAALIGTRLITSAVIIFLFFRLTETNTRNQDEAFEELD